VIVLIRLLRVFSDVCSTFTSRSVSEEAVRTGRRSGTHRLVCWSAGLCVCIALPLRLPLQDFYRLWGAKQRTITETLFGFNDTEIHEVRNQRACEAMRYEAMRGDE
jgi:hypothetical protein